MTWLMLRSMVVGGIVCASSVLGGTESKRIDFTRIAASILEFRTSLLAHDRQLIEALVQGKDRFDETGGYLKNLSKVYPLNFITQEDGYPIETRMEQVIQACEAIPVFYPKAHTRSQSSEKPHSFSLDDFFKERPENWKRQFPNFDLFLGFIVHEMFWKRFEFLESHPTLNVLRQMGFPRAANEFEYLEALGLSAEPALYTYEEFSEDWISKAQNPTPYPQANYTSAMETGEGISDLYGPSNEDTIMTPVDRN